MSKGEKDGSHEQELGSTAGQTIGETHMVVPSVLTLFGFQLMVATNPDFRTKLALWEQYAHLTSLVLVAISAALVMTPAAYHRQAEPKRISHQYVDLVSAIIPASLALLMFAISTEVYLIWQLVTGKRLVSAPVALALLATCAGLWFVLPRRLARRLRAEGRRPEAQGRGARDAEEQSAAPNLASGPPQ
ncbi:MAG TPA: DUF6328 family protein [Polyangiaceae bacterium]|nr:DUF6328 family protein [Polyangiaceae bacterium]